MSNSQLSQPGVEIVEPKKESYHAVANFLGRNPEEISENFMQQFDRIRNDTLSVLPEQIKKYNIAKKVFESKNKGQIYTDPRVESIDVDTRKKLLSFAPNLKIREGIPLDIVVRAVSAIRKTAILALEGKNPASIAGISKEQKLAEEGLRQVNKIHNFFARNRR